MIKIAFVIDTIESPTAGTEKQLLLLIRKLDRSRFTPYLFVLYSSSWLDQEFDGCELINLNITSLKRPSSWLGIVKLARTFKALGIDVVQAHFFDGALVGGLAARLARVKVVLGTRRNQGYWLTRRKFYLQKIINLCFMAFIVNAESTKKWIVDNESVPGKKVHVVYNGIDFRPFAGLDTAVRFCKRDELNIPQQAPVVGIVANLRPVKRIVDFLHAARIVKDQVPQAIFIIVGDGQERPALQALTAELGLEPSVFFLGLRTDIPELLSAFDVGVLSSHSESFSNSVIEYLAAGLPVVATDVGGIRELIRHGENGYVVSPQDHQALAKYITVVLTGNLEKNEESRLWVKTMFSIEKIVGFTERLYEQLLCETL